MDEVVVEKETTLPRWDGSVQFLLRNGWREVRVTAIRASSPHLAAKRAVAEAKKGLARKHIAGLRVLLTRS